MLHAEEKRMASGKFHREIELLKALETISELLFLIENLSPDKQIFIVMALQNVMH